MKVYSSARSEEALTASDSTLVTCNALYVGTGGNITINRAETGGTSVTYVAVPTGSYLLVDLKNGRVMSTNTTASDLVAVTW